MSSLATVRRTGSWIDDADVPTGFGRHFPNSLVIRPSDRFGLFARDAIRVRDFLT